MLKIAAFLALAIALSSCATNGIPAGSVAWCGEFSYTGTWLKTETNGRAIGLSDGELAQKLTVEQVIALAESMGCGEG